MSGQNLTALARLDVSPVLFFSRSLFLRSLGDGVQDNRRLDWTGLGFVYAAQKDVGLFLSLPPFLSGSLSLSLSL